MQSASAFRSAQLDFDLLGHIIGDKFYLANSEIFKQIHGSGELGWSCMAASMMRVHIVTVIIKH
jgi:hypothetical protein